MITWRDNYNVGVDQIDSQHKELVARLNDFMEACAQQKAKEKIEETLEFLKSYTMEHFQDEETLMKQVAYPEYDDHKKEHDNFVAQIEQLIQQVREKGTSVLATIKLNRVLVEWLLNHIQRIDVKVGDYIKANSDQQ
ncbi:MAG: hemerythrin-like metal-binding protein [Paenibacillaceae bacterium]|jgi:hemerythrin|nr:hemerythrin-like metal-binding protein [Paenibacillaceae bacterium]